MKTHPRRAALVTHSLALLCLAAGVAAAQSPPPRVAPCEVKAGAAATGKVPPGTPNGIKLVVTDGQGKLLERKRFYLLGKSVREAGLDFSAAPSREEYLKKASPQLREWMKKYDCDSLYCPEYEAAFDEAVKAGVPEFKEAYERGLRRYGNDRELALKWITVNFPLKDARTAYYKRKRDWVRAALLKLAGGNKEEADKTASVMTDEKGAAYFTEGVKKGQTYYITNLVPTEDGHVLWDCKVTAGAPNPRQLYSVVVEFDARKAPQASAATR